MIIETKYDIGQELYFISSKRGTIECPHCGGIEFTDEDIYYIHSCDKIQEISFDGCEIFYKIGDRTFGITDKSIGINWFTTHKAAKAECKRRNKRSESGDL